MVHSGLKKSFSMKLTPQPNGAQLWIFSKRIVRKIARQLLGRQINIGENDDPGTGLLQYLSAPTGFFARVESFAAVKAQQLEHFDQRFKTGSATSISVMIMIGPA